MNIFVIAFIASAILGILNKGKYLSKKYFCIYTGIIYFLIASLRHRTVGGDTDIYCNWFRMVSTENLYELMNSDTKDPFFSVMLSLLGKITHDYTIFLTIVALIFTICIWHLIYKHSKDACLSIVIMLALNLYQFSLTGVRQTIAMAFVSLYFSVSLANNKGSWRALPLLGALFHKSAFISYLWELFEISYRKIGKKAIALFLAVSLVFFVILRRHIAVFFAGTLSERGYSISNEGGGENMSFLIIALYVFCLLITHNKLKNRKLRLLFIMVLPAVMFEALVPLQNIFFRIAFYFLILFIVLIPECIHEIKNLDYRRITTILMYVLFSCLYLFITIGSARVLPYKFFWE